MSPEAARLLSGCAMSFLLGGVAAVFGLRTLYGPTEQVEPSVDIPLECPPPPPCPACPPPSDCSDGDALPEETFTQNEWTPSPAAQGSGTLLPGLPASAIPRANTAIQAAITVCRETVDPSASGVVLLKLTVTATGTGGFIRDALVVQAPGLPSETADCFAREAKRARFDWTGADGELTFKLPVSVGPTE